MPPGHRPRLARRAASAAGSTDEEQVASADCGARDLHFAATKLSPVSEHIAFFASSALLNAVPL